MLGDNSADSCVKKRSFMYVCMYACTYSIWIFSRKPPPLAIGAYLVYTGGGGPVCECTVECTLGVQLSGIACFIEKPLHCTLIRRLLEVAGAFHKRSLYFAYNNTKRKNNKMIADKTENDGKAGCLKAGVL